MPYRKVNTLFISVINVFLAGCLGVRYDSLAESDIKFFKMYWLQLVVVGNIVYCSVGVIH